MITPFNSLVVVTPPASEPISLAEAKRQCRVDTADDDTYITSLITVAREYAEGVLGVSFATTVWRATYNSFPTDGDLAIYLPRHPFAPTGEATISYIDLSGNSVPLTTFSTDKRAIPPSVRPSWLEVWPAARQTRNAVTVQWPAGYSDSGSTIPTTARHAMLLLIAHWYETRQPVSIGQQAMQIPTTLETLLAAAGDGIYR